MIPANVCSYFLKEIVHFKMEIERQWKSTECTQMEKSMKLKGNSLKKMINKIDKPKTILTKETKRK